jgi:hypothetical protein
MRSELAHHLHEAHEHAKQCHGNASSAVNTEQDVTSAVYVGVLASLVALVSVQTLQWREMRRIRKLIEAEHDRVPVALNMTGMLVDKHPSQGGDMPEIGPFNPSDSQDVLYKIAPVNAAGLPVAGPFAWTSSDPNVKLEPATDTLSCRAVVAPGVSVDDVDVVTYPPTGLNQVSRIQRTVVPPDNTPVERYSVPRAAPLASVGDGSPGPRAACSMIHRRGTHAALAES